MLASGSAILRVSRAAESPPRWTRTDPEVVEAAKRGCDASFAVLYAGLGHRVHETARRVLGDVHEAEDAAQDTFLQAFRRLHRLEDARAFETWLMRIARNTAVTRARRRVRCRPSPRAHDEAADQAAGMPRVVRRSGAVEPPPAALALFRATYDELPDGVRETVRLRYERGLSCQEIADCQALSLSCVKTRLHRARKRLRRAVLGDGAQE